MYVSVFASDLSIVPFPVGSESKESAFNVGDSGLIPAESDVTVHLSSSSIPVKL